MFFQKKKFIDDIQDSLTGDTIEQSDSGRKNNPCLLQGDEGLESEEAVNVEANKIDEDNNDMIISMEE